MDTNRLFLFKPTCLLIFKIIGEGTYGVVHEAIYIPTGQKLAVKSIKKQPLIYDKKALAVARREMTILHSLEGHENIIRMVRKEIPYSINTRI